MPAVCRWHRAGAEQAQSSSRVCRRLCAMPYPPHATHPPTHPPTPPSCPSCRYVFSRDCAWFHAFITWCAFVQ